MTKRRKKLILIVVGILLWGAMFSTDFYRQTKEKPPIFCIKTLSADDGGSTEWVGIGYKVQKVVNRERYWEQGDTENGFDWYIMPWFINEM
jgi:hypothetical protein